MMSCPIPTIPPGPTRRRVARRRKRGLSALTATLLLSLGLAAGFVGFAQSEALRLRDAQINRLDRWARQEARALHFWLHEKQAEFREIAVESAQQVGSSENPPNGLLAHRAPWASVPRGFRARYVVANPRVQANNPDNDPALTRAHGILVISTRGPDTVDGNERYLLTGLCRALASSDTAARQAEALAGKALRDVDFGAPGCDVSSPNAGTDPGRAVAVFAAPLAGINENLVLRAPRSGFAPAAMETDLHMGDGDDTNDICGIGTFSFASNRRDGAGHALEADAEASVEVEAAGRLVIERLHVSGDGQDPGGNPRTHCRDGTG